MANSAHTWTEKTYNAQIGNVGTKRTRRGTLTFGSDYAAAKLPLITADEVGLATVHAVIVEGAAAGTAVGASVSIAKATGGANFTAALFNGTTAVGTVDESGTTVELTIIGN
jgi:hypothetical protein